MLTSFFYCQRKKIVALIICLVISSYHNEQASANPGEVNELALYDGMELDTFKVIATGYTAGPESTGKSVNHPAYGITYSGVKVCRNMVSTIAADPKVFPIGTIMYIPNYGYAVVADTGSAIKGHRIDLYFETVEEVYKQWGKKEVQVTILKRGDGLINQEWLNELNKQVEQNKVIPASYLQY